MLVKREKSVGMEVGESIRKTCSERPSTVQSRVADRGIVPSSLRYFCRGYLPAFTSSGAVSLKLSADSAGRTISLLPVNAAPPVPAPAPAAAPIAAPLPPPANPPMIAPSAVPPPANTAVRFPLPFSVRVTAEVLIRCSLPLTVIEFNLSSRIAPPLNLPKGFASTTVPRANAPAGITVFPSTVTGEARVALNDCPVELIFDPKDSPSLTVRVVPAGTTKGCGAGATAAGAAVPGAAGALIAFPPAAFDGAAMF